MIVIPLQNLYEKAKQRPEGYIEDVLSYATISGENYILNEEDYEMLKNKYRNYKSKLINAEQVSINEILIKSRLEICRNCEEYNGNICEIKYPKGVCYCSWNDFLINGECPLKKWNKNELV